MPHAELKYSDDLYLDCPAIMKTIEDTILAHDSGSGACKGRSYPAADFHHSHLLITVAMLAKPHRDQSFTDALVADLQAVIKAHVTQPCFFSLDLTYAAGAYVTNEHHPH